MSYRALLAAREARARSSWKDPVDVVAVSTVAASGEQTIDGVALVKGDYVLRTADGVDNGIWQVQAGPWIRREDADIGWKLQPGTRVPIANGTFAGKVFRLTNASLATVGVDILSFINELEGVEGWAVSNIVAADSPYTASFGELVRCDATSGPITVNLPAIAAAHDGKVVAVQKTDASGNAITMDGNSSQTINGSATATLTTQWERAGLVADNASGDWSK